MARQSHSGQDSNLVDDDSPVEPHEDAGDDGEQDAPNHHEGPEEDGEAGDGHAERLQEGALAADEVVQQPLPALEEHVGALDQRDHRVERDVHGQPQDADQDTRRHIQQPARNKPNIFRLFSSSRIKRFQNAMLKVKLL
jgi:hypothetical protein